MDYKRFSASTESGVVRVRFFAAKLEDEVTADLNDELIAFLRNRKPERVLIDFARVIFISSEAINLFFLATRKIKAHGGRLKFCGMEEEVRRIFRLLKLDENIFQIYGDAGEAIEAFDAE